MGSRAKKSIKNVSVGIVGLSLNLLISFISRSFFITILGIEYNGVNGLFSNILQVLSLAELGFAAAIAYALYKPLKECDEQMVAALMTYYKKIYRIIALIVACIGALCIPFLQYLIADDISKLPFSISQIRLYYTLYLINSVCSYLLAYKRTLITADQNAFINSTVDYTCNILLNVLQIILLIVTKNYLAFLLIMIAKTVANNFIIHVIANKKYSYLKKYKRETLDSKDKKIIFDNVKALFLNRLGNVFIYGTTSILISALVSIADAGIYANYLMIVTNIKLFVDLVFDSLTASIGNLSVSENKEYQYKVFKRVSYVGNFFSLFTFVCFLGLFNDFIDIWLGENFTFDLIIVFAISFNAMLMSLRKATSAYKTALGLFQQDWYRSIVEAIVCLGLAFALSFKFGTLGIIAGYSIGGVFVGIPIENFVLFKYGFEMSLVKQLIMLLLVILWSSAVAIANYYLISLLPKGVGWFVLETVISLISSVFIFVICTFKTEEFNYFKSLAKNFIVKIKNKIKFSKES